MKVLSPLSPRWVHHGMGTYPLTPPARQDTYELSSSNAARQLEAVLQGRYPRTRVKSPYICLEQPTHRYGYATLVRDGYDWSKLLPHNELPPVSFHGTSTVFLDAIVKNGLDAGMLSMSHEEFDFMEETLKKINRSSYHQMLFTWRESLSLTFNLGRALKFAIDGPEYLRRLMQTWRKEKRVAKRKMAPSAYREFRSLMKKHAELLVQHKPVLIVSRQPIEESDYESIYDKDRQMLFDQVEHAEAMETARRITKGTNVPAADIIHEWARYQSYAHHPIRVTLEDIIGIIPIKPDPKKSDSFTDRGHWADLLE